MHVDLKFEHCPLSQSESRPGKQRTEQNGERRLKDVCCFLISLCSFVRSFASCCSVFFVDVKVNVNVTLVFNRMKIEMKMKIKDRSL